MSCLALRHSAKGMLLVLYGLPAREPDLRSRPLTAGFASERPRFSTCNKLRTASVRVVQRRDYLWPCTSADKPQSSPRGLACALVRGTLQWGFATSVARPLLGVVTFWGKIRWLWLPLRICRARRSGGPRLADSRFCTPAEVCKGERCGQMTLRRDRPPVSECGLLQGC